MAAASASLRMMSCRPVAASRKIEGRSTHPAVMEVDTRGVPAVTDIPGECHPQRQRPGVGAQGQPRSHFRDDWHDVVDPGRIGSRQPDQLSDSPSGGRSHDAALDARATHIDADGQPRGSVQGIHGPPSVPH